MFKLSNKSQVMTGVLPVIINHLNIDSLIWKSLSDKQKEDLIIKTMLQAAHVVLDHVNKYCNLSKCLLDFKEPNSVGKLQELMMEIIGNMPSPVRLQSDMENELIIFILEKDLRSYNVNHDNQDALRKYVENIDLDLIDADMDLQMQTKKFYFASQALNRGRIEQHLELIRLLPKALDSDNASKRILLWQKTIFNVILESINSLLAKNTFNLQLQAIRNKVVTQTELVDIFLKSFDKTQSGWANSLLCFGFGAKCIDQDDFASRKRLYRFNKPS